VSDGIRTRDPRDHNPVLYQLSYTHQAPPNGGPHTLPVHAGADRAAIARAAAESGPGGGTNTAAR
jgi:hypothetical protein